MKKRAKEKSLFEADSLDACLRWCKLSGMPYDVSVSNYTTSVSGHLNRKYVKDEKSIACFAGAYKIKSDILKSNIHVDVDKDEVSYYDTNLKPMVSDKIYNIDLKSAYATILRNDKLITNATFNYISKLPKPDRLAAVGMLASHKYNFNYTKNKINNFSEEINEMETYFYYCVHRTFEVMKELKRICGDSYLFCWVDSIYFTDYSKSKKIMAYLRSIRFKGSFETLSNVVIKENKNHFKINFTKEGKIKLFNIPRSNGSFSRSVISKYIKYKS